MSLFVGDYFPDSRAYSQPVVHNRTIDTDTLSSTSSSAATPCPDAILPETRKIFKMLLRNYMRGTFPTKAELRMVNSTPIDTETFLLWSKEAGDSTGVELKNGRVIFEEYAEPPHDDLVNYFNRTFDAQVNPGDPPDTPFHSQGTKSIQSHNSRADTFPRYPFARLWY